MDRSHSRARREAPFRPLHLLDDTFDLICRRVRLARVEGRVVVVNGTRHLRGAVEHEGEGKSNGRDNWATRHAIKAIVIGGAYASPEHNTAR